MHSNQEVILSVHGRCMGTLKKQTEISFKYSYSSKNVFNEIAGLCHALALVENHNYMNYHH